MSNGTGRRRHHHRRSPHVVPHPPVLDEPTLHIGVACEIHGGPTRRLLFGRANASVAMCARSAECFENRNVLPGEQFIERDFHIPIPRKRDVHHDICPPKLTGRSFRAGPSSSRCCHQSFAHEIYESRERVDWRRTQLLQRMKDHELRQFGCNFHATAGGRFSGSPSANETRVSHRMNLTGLKSRLRRSEPRTDVCAAARQTTR